MELVKAETPTGIHVITTEFWQAVRDTVPILCGAVPFGITYGIMGITAGLTPLEVLLMSLLVFAGSAQFISVTMLGAGITGWGIIVFTTLLVNLRHFLMGASLAPYILRFPISLQAFLAFVLTDEAYAVTASRIDKVGYSVSYQLGTSISMYLAWALATITGVVVGSYIPNPLAWGLDFAIPATFLVLLFPRLVNQTSLIVCGVAGVTAVWGALYLPGKWYMIGACIVATIVGGFLEGDADAH
jgi:4-azaleucine resistance transporter AzlC